MKKSIINIILVSSLSIILLIYSGNTSSITVFKAFDNKDISSEVVNKALKGDDDSLHDIASVVLDNIDYKQWKDDPTIKIQICKGKIISGKAEEVIVGISLPPDTGIISILKPAVDADKYDIFYTSTDLVPIDSMKLINTPKLKNSLIYVKETLNENFGAFFNSTIVEVYAWTGNTLEVVWNGTESYTSCWNTIWEENSSEGKWKKIDEKALISMSKDNTEITVFSDQSYAESNYPSDILPDNNKFKPIKTRKLINTYYLDSELKKFVLGTALLNDNTTLYDYDGISFIKKQELPTGEKIKLLQDLDELADNLVSDDYNYYKVLTSNGLTGYISKEAVSIK